MGKCIDSVLVLGLGKVGHLAAHLLHETGFAVTGVDLRVGDSFDFPIRRADVLDLGQLAGLLRNHDAVVSCLPFHLNTAIAEAAVDIGVHYFDLTEDVAVTTKIVELSCDSRTVMAPQCGLAPGFIAIVGAFLASRFSRVRSIKLRAGALPKHPTGLLGYAFNWSPAGVVNEYLNDCQVIEEGVRKWVSPMEWIEKIVIDGLQLEAFTTSGGLGTMCDTYDGIVENLDYKSIRYPGHATMMNFFLHELLLREDRERAGQILVNAKPPVSEDVVYIHASGEGWLDDQLVREEFVRTYSPKEIVGMECRAIAWTTAAALCGVIELVNDGELPDRGLIRQESIPLEKFFATQSGRLYGDLTHGGSAER